MNEILRAHLSGIAGEPADRRIPVDRLVASTETAHSGPFSAPPANVVVNGVFDETCLLALGPAALQAIQTRRGRLDITSMVPGTTLSGCIIYVHSFTGRIEIFFGSGGTVLLGELGIVRIDARIGHGGIVAIGDRTTINGARFVAVNSNVIVGRDGLWSDDILVQGFDQHGILDVASREFINLDRRDVVIDEHVWIGRRATLLPGSSVGRGSVVGACAAVTRAIPELSAAAGTPARVVRSGITWARPWTQIDPETALFLDRLDADQTAP